MIPANIDYQAIVRELNSYGFGNYKIDTICGFADGCVAYVMAGYNRDMTYQRAARLYNFWCEERTQRGLDVLTPMFPLFPEKTPALVATT